MKFTKYNNPAKKHKKHYIQKHSEQYINEKKSELYNALLNANNEQKKDIAYKAYYISLKP